MPKKAIFLDRDGVINKEVSYLYKIEDFEFVNGIFDACLYFQNLGYKIIIVTNQSGISRGYYSENDYQVVTRWMLKQFETLLEAMQRAPQRFDSKQEEKITTGGLECYQIPAQQGDLHEFH